MISLEDILFEYEIPHWKFRKPQVLKTVEDNKSMLIEVPGRTKISDTNFYTSKNFPYDNNMESVIAEFLQFFNRTKGYTGQWHGHCWHQVYKRGDWHGWHTHPHTNMSSVINIQCQEGQGTVFKVGEVEYQYPSREGTIISFPSSLLHCTLPHESDEPRIIASFNWDNMGLGE